MRLFIGVAPDDQTREALAETARMLSGSRPGHYVEPELYHITLYHSAVIDRRRVYQPLLTVPLS